MQALLSLSIYLYIPHSLTTNSHPFHLRHNHRPPIRAHVFISFRHIRPHFLACDASWSRVISESISLEHFVYVLKGLLARGWTIIRRLGQVGLGALLVATLGYDLAMSLCMKSEWISDSHSYISNVSHYKSSSGPTSSMKLRPF